MTVMIGKVRFPTRARIEVQTPDGEWVEVGVAEGETVIPLSSGSSFAVRVERGPVEGTMRNLGEQIAAAVNPEPR